MRNIILLFLPLIINCKGDIKPKSDQPHKSTILNQIDKFNILYIDSRTAEAFETYIYVNDSVFYEDEFNGEGMHFYKKGKKYKVEYSENVSDSLIELYHLKKIEFDIKNKEKYHFEYEDCILKQKIKMDSGAVHTLRAKNGATYQIIDIEHKPLCLQVCHQGKTYKEPILSRVNNSYGKLLGNGRSNAALYDVDKDDKDELLIFIDDGGGMKIHADVYKINLPK